MKVAKDGNDRARVATKLSVLVKCDNTLKRYLSPLSATLYYLRGTHLKPYALARALVAEQYYFPLKNNVHIWLANKPTV